MKDFARQHPRPLTLLLVCLALAPRARAEDLTTLSGTTYHQARAVRAEPDGVIWEHATGVCKVDFSDLPETIRKSYHYDAGKAAAYQAAQTQANQQVLEQARQGQQELAARRAKLAQEFAAQPATDAGSGNLTYRQHGAADAGQQSFNEWIASKKAAHDLLTKDDGTVWDRRLWAIPCLLTGGYSPGVAFDPHTDLNSAEYRASLHHANGGFAPDCVHDSFFKPDYLTKSYYQDVERAEAFARGHP